MQDTKSTYKNQLFLYANNELFEKEMKTILLTIATKRMKHLGIILTKEARELYTENYKKLMKKIKEDTGRWKASLCSWIGRINIVKIFISLKINCRFSAISIKISMAFFFF